MIEKWVLLYLRHRCRVLTGGRFAYWCIGLLLSATAIANTANEPAFKTDLIPGSNNSDVIKLQRLLNRSSDTQIATSGSGSPGNETSEFGPATMSAVIAFQNKYADEILTPFGYETGTGNVAAHTRKKLNSLYAELTKSTTPLSRSTSDTEDISHEPLPLTTGPSNQLDDIIDETPEAVEFINANNASTATAPPKKLAKKTYFSRLRLAPITIRTGGSIRYTQGRQKIGQDAPLDTKEIRTALRLVANTYIIRRSVALMSSDIRLDSNVQRTGKSPSRTSNNWFGDLTLRIFPFTNFPFRASISQTRIFRGFSLLDTPESTASSLSLQQNYTTHGRRDIFFTRYNQTRGSNSQSSQILSGSFQTSRFKKHVLFASAATRREKSSTNRLSTTLIATHKYDFRKSIVINNFASLHTRRDNGLSQNNDSNSLQFSTFATWRPTKRPYSATASARALQTTSKSSTATIKQTTKLLNGNIGLTYRYARFIRMQGSANFALTESNGVRKQKFTISGTIASGANNNFKYPLGSSTLGGFRYTRHINVRLSTRSSLTGASGNTSTASSKFQASIIPSHKLDRNMTMLGGTVRLDLQQALPISLHLIKNKRSRRSARATLTHRLAASWSTHNGARVRLTATDARGVLGGNDSYQAINLQGSLRGSLSLHSSWKGALTLQATAQNSDTGIGTPIISRSTSSNISFSYRHARVFGMPKLQFTSTIYTAGNGILKFQASDPKDNVRSTWKNRLSYKIGRLEVGLDVELAKVNDSQRSLILFTIERKFGAMH